MYESQPIKSFTKTCILCSGEAFIFTITHHRKYFRCKSCHLIFLDSTHYATKLDEKVRYATHNNDVQDLRYQKFVSPITTAIQNDFDHSAKGLDYGCGTGPVATFVLKEKGYNNINLYDPFFEPHQQHLRSNYYDFIICCEVMEHFHFPSKEFLKLSNFLKTGGQLYCKTKLFLSTQTSVEFDKWYYKNDKTHVCFYSLESLDYIAQKFNLKLEQSTNELISFKC